MKLHSISKKGISTAPYRQWLSAVLAMGLSTQVVGDAFDRDGTEAMAIDFDLSEIKELPPQKKDFDGTIRVDSWCADMPFSYYPSHDGYVDEWNWQVEAMMCRLAQGKEPDMESAIKKIETSFPFPWLSESDYGPEDGLLILKNGEQEVKVKRELVTDILEADGLEKL